MTQNTSTSQTVALVTGANRGIGRHLAAQLLERGAKVYAAARRPETIDLEGVEKIALDITDPSSVAAAAALATDVDLLINNAGAVLLGPRRTSPDGFELMLATNLLGHFALTGLLLPHLTERVVNLSSITHKTAKLDFDDLMYERNYGGAAAYGRAKLACTIFGIELDRRLRAAGSPVISVLAHPGMTRTNLTPRAWQHLGRWGRIVSRIGLLTTQSVERGTQPQLRAATAPGVRGGQFFGPRGPFEMFGPVTEVRPSREAADPTTGNRLWTAAENLTGVRYL